MLLFDVCQTEAEIIVFHKEPQDSKYHSTEYKYKYLALPSRSTSTVEWYCSTTWVPSTMPYSY